MTISASWRCLRRPENSGETNIIREGTPRARPRADWKKVVPLSTISARLAAVPQAACSRLRGNLMHFRQ